MPQQIWYRVSGGYSLPSFSLISNTNKHKFFFRHACQFNGNFSVFGPILPNSVATLHIFPGLFRHTCFWASSTSFCDFGSANRLVRGIIKDLIARELFV